MRHTVMLLTVLLIFGSILCLAQEEAAPEEKNVSRAMYTGEVHVTKDDAGKVTAITFLVSDMETETEYMVTLDDEGMKLADHDNDLITVSGTVKEKMGKKWLTVIEIEENDGSEEFEIPAE